MHILAHALRATAGAPLMRRRWAISRPVVISTVVLALSPDVFHLLQVAGWWMFAEGSFDIVRTYAIAVPGQWHETHRGFWC